MEKTYAIIGVVEGAHYVLSYKGELKDKEEAFGQMLLWKNDFNNKPYFFTAQIGESIDVIRSDTIKKMYIKTEQK